MRILGRFVPRQAAGHHWLPAGGIGIVVVLIVWRTGRWRRVDAALPQWIRKSSAPSPARAAGPRTSWDVRTNSRSRRLGPRARKAADGAESGELLQRLLNPNGSTFHY